MSPRGWHWQPPRLASCTCGWSARAGTLAALDRMAAAHVAEGCEGCDHAIFVESSLLGSPVDPPERAPC